MILCHNQGKLELSLTGFSDYASWERGASNYWGNVLFNRALRSKAFRKLPSCSSTPTALRPRACGLLRAV